MAMQMFRVISIKTVEGFAWVKPAIEITLSVKGTTVQPQKQGFGEN